MKRNAVGSAMLLAGAVLAGCATERPAVAVDPFRFFDGAARSHGTVTTALVIAEGFTADFQGHRSGSELVLDERFHFPGGDRLQRWRLAAGEDGRLAGTVETEGPSGALHAPVPVSGGRRGADVELRYDGFAPGGDTRLHFRHRMTGRPNGTMENRVRVSKFGIPLAAADVVFERVPQSGKIR